MEELFDVFDLKAGGFEAFDHAEGFQFVVVEFSDAGFAFEVGKKAFFVVVAKGGDREMEHFGYLADGVHGDSSFGVFVFIL